MNSGLKPSDIKLIQNVLKNFPELKEALFLGSRAMGNHKKGSDIDICIKGDISFSLLAKIKGISEEYLPPPYFFDVIDYNSINNPDLKKHVDEYGESFYKFG